MIKEFFALRTIRKKIIIVSKAVGIVLIISYILSTRLPVDPDISFWIWLGFVMLLVRQPVRWHNWIFLLLV